MIHVKKSNHRWRSNHSKIRMFFFERVKMKTNQIGEIFFFIVHHYDDDDDNVIIEVNQEKKQRIDMDFFPHEMVIIIFIRTHTHTKVIIIIIHIFVLYI